MRIQLEKKKNHSPACLYDEKIDFFKKKLSLAKRNLNTISNGRLISSLTLLGLIIYQLTEETSYLFVLLSTLSFLLFVWLLTIYSRTQQNIDDWNTLLGINIDGLHRIKREWDKLREPCCPEEFRLIPEAKDLNIVGHASLLKLIGTVESSLGNKTILSWLFNKKTNFQEIAMRQESIAELADKVDLRQSVQLVSRKIEEKGVNIESFIEWCNEAPWLLRSQFIIWTVWGLSGLTLASALAHLSGLTQYPVWLVFVLLNIAFSFYHYSKVDAIFNSISKREKDLSSYIDLFRLVEAKEFKSKGLQRIVSGMKMGGDAYPSVLLERLKKIIAYSDIRFSPMVYFIVQSVTLWNFHVVYFLEKWKAKFSPDIRTLIAASSEFEATCSLAGLKFENPEWAFPQFHENGSKLIQAKGLGHPLLHDGIRVGNDVVLGTPETFLFITGSNMAGKSTFLRSIGVNALLAQAGSVVCAESLSLPFVDVVTSIQVEDSIEGGVSFFMAELQRLKLIVDRAGRNSSDNRTTLYLLDEILRGTNSFDRRSAVRIVLKKLLRLNTIGAVTTHDLELASCKDLSSASEAVHFTEHVTSDGSQIMEFDYKMHEGISKTTNALKLLAAIGLCEEGI